MAPPRGRLWLLLGTWRGWLPLPQPRHTLLSVEGAALAEHPAFELWDKGCYDLGWRYDSSIVHDRADGGIFAGA